MPPAGARPLPAEVRRRMASMLHRDIEEFDYSTLDDPGFELMRRLTHTEYDNTVRDLFGVALNVTDRFPDELTGSSGFENSSNTLFLQPALMERYIAAAERVVELALPAEPTDVRHRASRDLVFVAAPGDGLGEVDAAEAVLDRFLGRAYRRPATAGELDQALAQYRSGRAAGLEHEVAVKRVLQAILISRSSSCGSSGAARARIRTRSTTGSSPRACPTSSGPRCPTRSCSTSRRAAGFATRRRSGRRSRGCSPTGAPTPWGPSSRRSGSASSTSAPASGSTPSTTRGAPRR